MKKNAEQKMADCFIWDNLLSMSAYWACSGSVVASLAAYYGFSISLSNIITGFTSALVVLQIFGGITYAHSRKPLHFLRIGQVIWRLIFPVTFLSVLLPLKAGGSVMLLSYFLSIALFQFFCPAQTSWMVDCVEGRTKSNFYASRDMWMMLSLTVFSCVVNLIIDKSQKMQLYQDGFIQAGIAAAVLMAVSMIPLFKLPAPAAPGQKISVKTLFEPFKNAGFRSVMIMNGVWCVSNMFIGGFSAVYQIQVMDVSFFSDHDLEYSCQSGSFSSYSCNG